MATRASRKHTRNRFARREAIQASYDVVLVVCEGKKTEPRYFEGLRKAYRLSSANVTVVPSDEAGGNDPLSLVQYAIRKLSQASADLDHVYCVFDRDGHANYDEACRLARESEFGIANRLHVIPSWPCFELWVLLHYEYTTTPFNAAGGKSACTRVIDRIRTHCATYQKGFDGIFEELFPRTDTALRNSQTLKTHNQTTGSINPATAVHLLVSRLRNLRPRFP